MGSEMCIRDSLSADTQSSSHPSPSKRPFSTISAYNNPSSFSEQPSKRSRTNSPSLQHYQGQPQGDHQAPAYALAGSRHNTSSAVPQLLNPSSIDEYSLARKISGENSGVEEGRASVSDGSAEADSSPSSSHQDRERGYSHNPVSTGHQQIPQDRPAKKRFVTTIAFTTQSTD